ncbi:28S ribosomal protein S15, mitochondrial [Condylostylus longicornis]|uniref:28S ribosomal protein S15, mitochondrial n=1 Tax=Condylostylus longicornis TaxID=2530218 RepID=UPI00244E0D70|nr:28S ribosomal protein S15, mitochondrial [Condylostylus longicornis]
MITWKILRPTNQIIGQLTRSFKSDLKIKWVRPEKIASTEPIKSGDAPTLPNLDPKEFVLKFRGIPELEQADEIVKDLFRLQNNRRPCTSQIYKEMFITDVQRHKLDKGSMEARIAGMTAAIRRLQDLMREHPRNIRIKCILKELIDKRKKFLKYLRRWDYKRFEWLLEKLDLIYKPAPSQFHWITRKESLQKLTNTHCENIRQERLDEYRKYLQSQQIIFLETKINNLEFIRKEQEECQVEVTVSLDDIAKVKKQLSELREARKSLEDNKEKTES